MGRSPEKIALDTNALLGNPNGLNVVEGLRDRFGSTARIVVPQQVEQELQVLKNRSKKIAKQVAIALLAMTAFGVKIRKVKADNADDALVRLAKTGWTVVSNDRELVTRIKALKRPVWSFSEKKGNAGIND